MNDWVRCEDEMPKESGYVIVWAPNGINQVKNLITMAYHFANTELFQTTGPYSYSIPGVTHWMPLPEPPK